MRVKNPELERAIRRECLDLLMVKEIELIGMRDIAARCGVSATTIYHYYADKDALLEAVKLDCLASMDEAILDRIGGTTGAVARLRIGMKAFRDWAFANPRIALLVMNRFKPNIAMNEQDFEKYYHMQNLALELLNAVYADAGKRPAGQRTGTHRTGTQRMGAHRTAASLGDGPDAKLESSLMIASLWGGIEAILMKRTLPGYWDKGVEFTDVLIERLLAGISVKEGK
jgi:AcrR family transcriptional regulator